LAPWKKKYLGDLKRRIKEEKVIKNALMENK